MIDKLKLSIRDFSIEKHAPLISQKTRFLNQESLSEKINFVYDDNTKVLADKSFLNTDFYNLTIREKDLAILEFNPSRIIHENNFFSIDNNQLKKSCEIISNDLKEKGIHFNLESSTISRIDLQKTKQMDYPFFQYEPIFNFLNASRMNNVKYQGYNGYINNSRQGIFYDKLSEMESKKEDISNFKGMNFIRHEQRLKNIRTVKSNLNYNTPKDYFSKINYYGLNDFYNNFLEKVIFRDTKKIDFKNERIDLNIDSEIRLINYIQSTQNRNIINDYLAIQGIENILKKFKTIVNFKEFLKMAGFSRMHIYNTEKKINIYFKLYMQQQKQTKNLLNKCYSELRNKFLAVA